MPTENELKWALNLNCEGEAYRDARKLFLIAQGYLVATKGLSLRIRKSSGQDEWDTRYTMTFKSNVGNRVVEIEKKIDRRDFDDLWPQCMNKLFKHRYEIENGHEIWEVDFFKDHNNETYFALAEIEMPEGSTKPESLPKYISSNLLYEVPLTDCRFSSKLLADVKYAKNLLKTLRK